MAIKDIVDEALVQGENDNLSKEEVYSTLRNKSYYLLGRYNFDINRINVNNESEFNLVAEEEISYKFNEHLTIRLNFLSVHRSKGLEAEFVFILNCNSGKVGFPSEMMDDPVLQLILGSSESYSNSEERRLFYVALSRAKEKTSCITNSNFTSKFILELDEKFNENNKDKCPRCKSGDLLLKNGTSKNGNHWAFKSCSNYAVYNCNYKVWL